MNDYFLAMFACQLSITGLIDNNRSKHFKIGKTAQENPYDRNDEKYQNKYERFIPIYGNYSLSLIDKLEVELIKYYKRCYPTKCDNVFADIGPALKGSNMGYIYVVIE